MKLRLELIQKPTQKDTNNAPKHIEVKDQPFREEAKRPEIALDAALSSIEEVTGGKGTTGKGPQTQSRVNSH